MRAQKLVAMPLKSKRQRLLQPQNRRKPCSAREGSAEAEALAKRILARTASNNIAITDKDVLSVLRLWKFSRKRTFGPPSGEDSTSYNKLGVVYRPLVSKCGVAAASRDNPNVTKLLCVYFNNQLLPELHTGCEGDKRQRFPFTTICMSKDDSGNRRRGINSSGPCACRAFGDFTGGHLRYWPSDPGQAVLKDPAELDAGDAVDIDHTSNFHVILGTHAHEVLPYQGEHYSLVYLTTNGYQFTPKALTRYVQQRFHLPMAMLSSVQNATSAIKAAYSAVPDNATSSALPDPPYLLRRHWRRDITTPCQGSQVLPRTVRAVAPRLPREAPTKEKATGSRQRVSVSQLPLSAPLSLEHGHLEALAARLGPGEATPPQATELREALMNAAARLRQFEDALAKVGTLISSTRPQQLSTTPCLQASAGDAN